MNLFAIWVELLFFIWLKESKLLSIWLKELFFFFERDWKNRTFLFLEYDSKNRTHFCLNTTQRIEPIKNWTLFKKNDSKNWTFFLCDSKNWTFLNMTQWIEPSLTWLEEFFFQKRMTQRIENFLSMSQRIEFLSFFVNKKNDSKNWAFTKNTIQRTELFFNMTQRFFQYDSKNWTLLYNMTQRLGFFHQKNSKNLTFLKTHRLEPFFKNCFKKNDSKNWSLFLTMNSQNGIFFEVRTRLTELFFFFQYDSQNWTCFFENDSKNHFWKRLKDFWNDPQNWTNEIKELKELNLFF